MSADLAMAFGSLVYDDIDGLTIEKLIESKPVRMRTAETPGRDGGYSQGGLLGPAAYTIHALLQADTPDDLRDRHEQLKAAHRPGRLLKLWFHSDRWSWAEFAGFGDIELDGTRGAWFPVEWSFHCADPLVYIDPAITTTGLASGGDIVNSGTEDARPELTIVVTSIGTSGTITVTNTENGDGFVLTPGATGTYVIDCYAQTCKRGGVLKPGEIAPVSYAEGIEAYLRLVPGTNALSVALGGSATLSAMTSVHSDAVL